MFKSDFKKSIRYKFLKDVAIILLINTCLLSAVIAINVGTTLESALTNKALSFASNIAKRNENALIMNGSTQLTTVYSELITDEEIIYTIIQDGNGKILTTQFESINFRWPGLQDILPKLSRDSELSDIMRTIKEYVAVKEISVPIMIGTDVLGRVTIGMSTHNIHKQIAKTAFFVIALNLVAAFILGTVLFITSRKTIMDPIIELGHAALRLAKGDLSTQVNVSSIGEIGMLVNSFNRMARDLKNTTVSKDYVDNIISSMIDTLIVVSSDGTILLANQAACSLLGYEQKELVGRPFDLLLGEQRGARDVMAEVFKGKSASNIEIYYVTKEGGKVSVLFSGSRMLVGDDSRFGVVCAAADITNLKKTEEALREANNKLNATLQASPAAIMALSPEGIVTLWNETAEALFGWSRNEVIGMVPPIVPEADQQGFRDRCRRILRGESFHDMEVQRIRKNGMTADVRLSAAPVHDSYGNVSSILVIMIDITDRKKMEGELLRIQKLESIGLLAGGIAHDFNNILASILGNINLLKLSLDPKDTRCERLVMAEKASLRATDLTRQLLTFSRGGAPIKKTTSIVKIVRDSAVFSLRGSNVKCEFDLPDDLWPIEADDGQMSQVIHNLVINAEQSMPEGGTIHIRAKNTVVGPKTDVPLKEGNYVKIAVEDHGHGIPDEIMDRIFDPYFTTKQEGSGLGLAITYSIIKNHGGYIVAKSMMRIGTEFTFFLPASDKKISEETPVTESPLYGKGKILVMDDDEMLRNVAGAMLTALGYEVGYARDGAEAVESYAAAHHDARPFDAVIMDLTVPGGMGGKEAIRKLRTLDPRVKAIVSSGYSQDAIMANYRDYGFVAVITKPYKITDLGSVLHEVLNSTPS